MAVFDVRVARALGSDGFWEANERGPFLERKPGDVKCCLAPVGASAKTVLGAPERRQKRWDVPHGNEVPCRAFGSHHSQQTSMSCGWLFESDEVSVARCQHEHKPMAWSTRGAPCSKKGRECLNVEDNVVFYNHDDLVGGDSRARQLF